MPNVYLSDNTQKKMWKVDENDNFSIITSLTFGAQMYANGGMAERIFLSHGGTIVTERHLDTLAEIATFNTQYTYFGLGGTATEMFYTRQQSQNQAVKFNPDTGATITVGPIIAGSGTLECIGGTDDRLFGGFSTGNKLHEFDTDTLVSLSGAGIDGPGNGLPTGISGYGTGAGSKLWVYDRGGGQTEIYQIDVDDLSIVLAGPYGIPEGSTNYCIGTSKDAPNTKPGVTITDISLRG
jgi:hypothetical protein